MFDMVSGIFCFVTATVSFLYGTRVCWMSGKECSFKTTPVDKKQILKASLPAGFAIYFFGFLIVFGYVMEGIGTIVIMSLTSALILSHFVVSMAMPALKRPPSNHKD